MRSILRLLIASFVLGLALPLHRADAYNYANYRWGGYWPSVPVDTSGLLLNAWRDSARTAMSDWNAAGARFTLYESTGSSNKMAYYYEVSGVLAYAPTWRKYGWWGDVVRGEVRVNNYPRFNPPYTSGTWYDLRSVLRHELGHWLVLWHVDTRTALMYKSFAPGEVRYLSGDEVNAVRSIYGAR